MSAELIVPDELKTIFRRLINAIPSELQVDDYTLRTTLIYLKFGGQRLARHWLMICRNRLREKTLMQQHKLREMARLEAVENSSDDDEGQPLENTLIAYPTETSGPGIELFESYSYDLFGLQDGDSVSEAS